MLTHKIRDLPPQLFTQTNTSPGALPNPNAKLGAAAPQALQVPVSRSSPPPPLTRDLLDPLNSTDSALTVCTSVQSQVWPPLVLEDLMPSWCCFAYSCYQPRRLAGPVTIPRTRRKERHRQRRARLGRHPQLRTASTSARIANDPSPVPALSR